jgi:hypothetical protein
MGYIFVSRLKDEEESKMAASIDLIAEVRRKV